MESIAEKLQLLNCPPEKYHVAYRHVASLNMSLEELEKVLRLLLEKGIIVPEDGEMLVEPADFCVLANGYDVINERIAKMGDELDAYREKLIRLNCKSAPERIEFLKQMEQPYKTPEGKYSKVPFSTRIFNGKYGFAKESQTQEQQYTKEEVVSKLEASDTSEQIQADVVTNVFDTILQSPQTNALTDETFNRFEKLTDSLRRVMLTVYGVEEINDSITDNLLKLVTSDGKMTTLDDADMLFASITYGKEISPEEAQRIRNSIEEEMQYINSMDIELGRAA